MEGLGIVALVVGNGGQRRSGAEVYRRRGVSAHQGQKQKYITAHWRSSAAAQDRSKTPRSARAAQRRSARQFKDTNRHHAGLAAIGAARDAKSETRHPSFVPGKRDNVYPGWLEKVLADLDNMTDLADTLSSNPSGKG